MWDEVYDYAETRTKGYQLPSKIGIERIGRGRDD